LKAFAASAARRYFCRLRWASLCWLHRKRALLRTRVVTSAKSSDCCAELVGVCALLGLVQVNLNCLRRIGFDAAGFRDL